MELTSNQAECIFKAEGLRRMFAELVAESKDDTIMYSYRHFKSKPMNHPDHSLKFLMDAVDRSIREDEAAEAKAARQKDVAKLISGNFSNDIKLASEVKAQRATQQANDKDKSALNALGAQLGDALKAGGAAQSEDGTRGRTRRRGGQPSTAGAQDDNTKPKAPPGAPDKGTKFFFAENGDKLPWISDEEFKRTKNCCYDFAHGQCKLSKEECQKQTGKIHDTLPKRLIPYVRKPKGDQRTGSRPPTPERKGGTVPFPDKWACIYCHKFAAGQCTKTEKECGKPHLTEEQAKAQAKGETWAQLHKRVGSILGPIKGGSPKGGGKGGDKGKGKGKDKAAAAAEDETATGTDGNTNLGLFVPGGVTTQAVEESSAPPGAPNNSVAAFFDVCPCCPSHE